MVTDKQLAISSMTQQPPRLRPPGTQQDHKPAVNLKPYLLWLAVVTLLALALAVVFLSILVPLAALAWFRWRRSGSRAAFLSAGMVAFGGLLGNIAVGALTDWGRRRHATGRLVGMAALAVLAVPVVGAFYLLPPSSALFLPVAGGFSVMWPGITGQVFRR